MDYDHQFRTGLVNTKFAELLNKYRAISTVRSNVIELCERSRDFKASFIKCLEYDIAIIEARSQNLDDHEISLVQKAFVTLMHEGGSHLAGIALYIEEILGLKTANLDGKERALAQFVEAKNRLVKSNRDSQHEINQSRNVKPLFKGLELIHRDDDSNASAFGHMHKDRLKNLGITSSNSRYHGEDINIRASPHMQDSGKDKLRRSEPSYHDECTNTRPSFYIPTTEDDKFRKLWNMYRQARDEYLETTEDAPNTRTKAAIFLRDTIENCIGYLDNVPRRNTALKPNDLHAMKRELSATLKIATDAAVEGLGGRKRHFDDIDKTSPMPRYTRRGKPRWDYSTRSVEAEKHGAHLSREANIPEPQYYNKGRRGSIGEGRLPYHSRPGADIYRPSQPDIYRPSYSPLFVPEESPTGD